MEFDAASAGELGAWVLARGQEGLARVEIAAALGVTLARLEARGKAEAALGEALALADEAAEAWWVAQPREALGAGARAINMAVWREAMDWRFGGGAGRREPPPARPMPRVIVNIPDNGRMRATASRPRSRSAGAGRGGRSPSQG